MTNPTLIFLPGLLCDEAVWAHQQAELSKLVECRIATYRDHSSITAMAEDVLSDSPPGPLIVVGHSMGGRVALELARLKPSRIHGLALLDTGTDPLADGVVGAEEVSRRMALLELAKREGMRAMGQQWARGMVHPDRVNSQVFEDILLMLERSTAQQFEAQLRALIARPDARPVFLTLKCPTLLICGRQDAWSPLERHETMHRQLPHSSLITIEESGHMTTMEQPEAVTQTLLCWVQENLFHEQLEPKASQARH